MARYYVIQFLASERDAWDISHDIRVLFGDKVHNLQQVPWLEDHDSDAIAPPREKANGRGRPRLETKAKRTTAPRGGLMREMVFKAIKAANGEWLRRRDISSYISAHTDLSVGNVSRQLEVMLRTGELVSRKIKGSTHYGAPGNGSKEVTTENG